jgi:hypothetical protein
MSQIESAKVLNGLYIDGKDTQMWYQNDVLHIVDGPAVERVDGSQIWFQNGQRHIEEGPAVVWPNDRSQWFLNDEQLYIEENLL